MKHFVDFETKNKSTLSNFYQLVHQVLYVFNKKSKTAVFFPDYFYNEVTNDGTTGLKLRVLSEDPSILTEIIKKTEQIKSVTHEGIQPVPDASEIPFYVNLKRVQKKNMSDKRRLAKRAVLTGRASSEAEAIEKMKFMDTFNNLPYLIMPSSSGNLYPIHLKISPSLAPIEGSFDAFGLSPTGTIPFF